MREEHKPFGLYERVFKRIFDILGALLAIILLGWLYIVLAILVRIKLGSPILFKQDRPGKNEKIFRLYKFRTMTDAKDVNGRLLPDEKRLSKFGATLRSTSLDELPEIINILKGDMSIVGPRPLLVRYLDRYTEEQRHRHDVRPGLTGYAQTHGRNGLPWEKKFEMDIKYIQKITFVQDMKIIFNTIKAVVKKEGISSSTSVTMEEFMGTTVNNSEVTK